MIAMQKDNPEKRKAIVTRRFKEYGFVVDTDGNFAIFHKDSFVDQKQFENTNPSDMLICEFYTVNQRYKAINATKIEGVEKCKKELGTA